MSVYKAINAVQADLAKMGISKDRNNQMQGYKFRGIDDVYNAMAPLLAQHGLCILPRVVSRECVERQNAKGTALFYVTVGAEFDFVCAEDGSKHTVATYGEAMDSGDKATNKAMSAAYKYACIQAFSIPTEGDNDADATTHEVRPKTKSTAQETADITPLSAEQSKTAAEAGGDIVAAFDDGRETEALEIWRSIDDNDIKIHLWAFLAGAPKIRSFIKANQTKAK